mgnify:CR=1 FL=1|tara:strand:+ start:2711 stop:3379 length:669 start_codon:yes stop_codon:yes gene_type:complete
MGVLIAGGVMAGVGALGGFLGAQGEAQQAQAQYLANKIQTEKTNFQNALKNDKQNIATARKNAQIRFNNRKIGEAALGAYGETLRNNKEMFQRNSANYAKQMVQAQATMEARATGKNIRGGMADRFKQMANTNFTKQRNDMRIQKFRADTSAKNVYQSALNQRDLMSRGEATMYMPGSTGIAPGSGSLNMLSAIIGGGASGAASGVNMGQNLDLSTPWATGP